VKYIFSALFVVAGIALLIVPNDLRIRGSDVSYGWLLLVVGALSLLWDFMKGRKGPPNQ
jgi:hypothetical protein